MNCGVTLFENTAVRLTCTFRPALHRMPVSCSYTCVQLRLLSIAAREDWLFKLLFLISSQMRLSGWSSIVEFLAKHSWRLTAIDSCNVIIINARLLICSFTRFSNCSEKTFLSYSPSYIIKLFVDRSSSTVKVTHWLGEDVAPPIRPRLMALYKCALIDWLIDWVNIG